MGLLDLTISGNKAILDGLAALEAKVKLEAQDKLVHAGEIALEYADENCPVLTGYLKSRNALYVEEGNVTVSNDAPYVIPVVLGHHTRSGSFVPPNDFLTPGFIQGEEYLKSSLTGLL